jgi:hypothetical protein
LHATAGEWAAATSAYEDAISALPDAVSQSASRADRAHSLSQFFALACDAAAAALNAGLKTRAIELLEAGRGVLLSQTAGNRALAERARAIAPDSARRLDEIAALLDLDELPARIPCQSAAEMLTAGSIDAELRVALERERKDLADKIRDCGLPQFQARPRIADLLTRVGEDLVIIVNTSRYRSDAMAITSGQIRVIPLPRLRWDTLLRQVPIFQNSVRNTQDGYQAGAVLTWLWHAAAEPILTALSLTSTPGDARPWRHVWWCPTGPLSFLPMHAAGLHPTSFSQQAKAETTIDRVISSYTPSIRAFVESGSARANGRPPSTLAVAIPDTPGVPPPLRGAGKEISLLRELLPEVRTLEGPDAARERVLQAIAAASRFHFAGHSRQDPLSSRDAILIPYDFGTAGPITMQDIAAVRRQPGELAYLSSCETASGELMLADEAAHVAGAFLSAGFRQVIGTAWGAQDKAALTVADSFYRGLADTGPGAVAGSLHDAVRQLRDTVAASDNARVRQLGPLLWAPFMHFGQRERAAIA